MLYITNLFSDNNGHHYYNTFISPESSVSVISSLSLSLAFISTAVSPSLLLVSVWSVVSASDLLSKLNLTLFFCSSFVSVKVPSLRMPLGVVATDLPDTTPPVRCTLPRWYGRDTLTEASSGSESLSETEIYYNIINDTVDLKFSCKKLSYDKFLCKKNLNDPLLH